MAKCFGRGLGARHRPGRGGGNVTSEFRLRIEGCGLRNERRKQGNLLVCNANLSASKVHGGAHGAAIQLRRAISASQKPENETGQFHSRAIRQLDSKPTSLSRHEESDEENARKPHEMGL